MPALRTADATETARLIARGEASSEEVVRACLERIAERDATVRAWAHLDPEAALAQARAADASDRRSPLHGVPVGVKDIIDTRELPTEFGSPIHAGRRPAADAACVARLRDAGAVILGKTMTTEFAYFHPAETRNPLDPGRTPGGSSSGSAAAVADGMVPLALGSQTAGSTIRPASFCGVFGLKPTHGLIDLTGVKRLSARLDTLGLFARSIDDIELLLDALTGHRRAAPDRRRDRRASPSPAPPAGSSWSRTRGPRSRPRRSHSRTPGRGSTSSSCPPNSRRSLTPSRRSWRWRWPPTLPTSTTATVTA